MKLLRKGKAKEGRCALAKHNRDAASFAVESFIAQQSETANTQEPDLETLET